MRRDDAKTSSPTRASGPLQNNGGPTLTHALEQGSKALGAGGPDCEDVDQRGQQRDNKCDLGAFER